MQKNEKIEKQIEDLVKELTLDEKIGMIHGAGLFRTAGVERLGIPPVKMSDGPMGVRNEFPDDSWVPVGNSDDYVTYLPSNSALASTWSRKLAYETGKSSEKRQEDVEKTLSLHRGSTLREVLSVAETSNT